MAVANQKGQKAPTDEEDVGLLLLLRGRRHARRHYRGDQLVVAYTPRAREDVRPSRLSREVLRARAPIPLFLTETRAFVQAQRSVTTQMSLRKSRDGAKKYSPPLNVTKRSRVKSVSFPLHPSFTWTDAGAP